MTTGRRGLGSALWDNPHVLLVLTMLFWSGNMVVARGASEHIPPIALAQMRWTLALLLLLPFAWPHLRTDGATLRRHWPMVALLGLLGIGLYNTLIYVALGQTTAINAMLLGAIFPLVLAAVGFVLYRDRLTGPQLAGIGVACVGAAAILSGGDLSALLGFRFTPGDLWVLASQLAYAGYTVLLRERPPLHPLTFLAASIFFGQLVLVPFTAGEAMLGARVTLDATTLLVVLYVAIFPALLAFICFNRAVQLIGSNRTGPYFHLVPVFGSVEAGLFLGERLGLHHAVGWACIILGIAVSQLRWGAGRIKPVPVRPE